MKNIIKILFFGSCILCFSRLSAQLDTLNYVKQFEVNKNQYIGKSFSMLLNDMTLIQPKTIWSAPHGRIKTITPASSLNFVNKQYVTRNSIKLRILWQEPISRDQTKYYEQKNQFSFTDDEKSFYSNKIVKDIKVYR